MKKKCNLKVLLVSPSPPPVGGIQSWTVNVIDFLKNQNEIQYCYIDSAVKYKDILEIGLWKRITAGIRVTIDLLNALKYTLPKENPNVIHLTSSASFALFKDYLILRLAKRHKTPVVIHWRFGRIPDLAVKKNWEWKLISHIIKKSAYSIVIDDNSYKTLKDAGFKNLANIANPISKELEKIALGQIGFDRKIEEGKIIFVGHVYVNKGIYELIQACSSIQKVKELKLIGPVKDEVSIELKNLATSREDGKWLKIAGSKTREEVYAEISSAELLVLPSYTEGFPNVIIEAMAMACPILATNVGAIPEMINMNGNNPAGLCVPIKDVQALKSIIEKMLADNDLQSKYGHNGLKRVLENYTLHHVMEQYHTVWHEFESK